MLKDLRMFIATNEKQFGFWKMRRSGMSNISIANLLGITRQGVSQALLAMDEKIDASLQEMAHANRIQVEKIDLKRGVLFGMSIPFQTNAYIFVSEKHGIQVWYEHEGDCISCDEFTKCIEIIWDFAAELGIKLEKTQDPTKMADELLTKIQEMQE
jgi:transcriptional regulator